SSPCWWKTSTRRARSASSRSASSGRLPPAPSHRATGAGSANNAALDPTGPPGRANASATVKVAASAATPELDDDHADRVHLGSSRRDGADAWRPLRLDRHLGAGGVSR